MTEEEKAVKFLTIGEVSKILRVSEPTVKKLIASGELPAKRVLHQFRIEQKDLEAYLRKL